MLFRSPKESISPTFLAFRDAYEALVIVLVISGERITKLMLECQLGFKYYVRYFTDTHIIVNPYY